MKTLFKKSQSVTLTLSIIGILTGFLVCTSQAGLVVGNGAITKPTGQYYSNGTWDGNYTIDIPNQLLEGYTKTVWFHAVVKNGVLTQQPDNWPQKPNDEFDPTKWSKITVTPDPQFPAPTPVPTGASTLYHAGGENVIEIWQTWTFPQLVLWETIELTWLYGYGDQIISAEAMSACNPTLIGIPEPSTYLVGLLLLLPLLGSTWRIRCLNREGVA